MSATVIPSTDIAYTPEQRRAIDARGLSVALAAGAGCGKTFVLTRRFAAALAPDGERDPEQRLARLVAITFTDAAARELRSRIRHLVRDRLATSSPQERDYWHQLGRALDSCRVSTIHSLCGSLLRGHAFAMGLDPLFAILDPAAAQVLQAEAIEDTLREELADGNDDAYDLAAALTIEGVKKHVAGLMEHHRTASFEKWLAAEPADALAAWQRYYRDIVWPAACAELGGPARELLTLLELFAPENGDAADIKQELMDALAAVSSGNASSEQLDTILELARSRKEKWTRAIPFTKSKWGDEALYQSFIGAAKKARDGINGLPCADFDSPSAHRAAELGLALARLTARAAKAYEQAKEQRDALDHDDTIALAHRLLTGPEHREVQQQLRDQIELLMVDEFQDTDAVQVEIVRALVGAVAKSGKLFFVGDDKQSIYRFRGAEPQVFVDLRAQVTDQGRLPLSTNFRSQPAILNFVNYLFHQVFDGDYQALTPNRPQVTPEPAVEFLWTVVDGQRSSKGWKERCRKAEARYIAARLRELIDGSDEIVADERAPGGRRRAVPGDVAILFRSLSDIQHYEAALRECEIDYYLVGGHAFYTQQEVYDLLHLLRVVASECDDLSLAGVLRSPFFSLMDETLYWLTAHGQSLNVALFSDSLPKELDAAERAKVVAARETIGHLRNIKHHKSVAELLAAAFERTGYDAVLLAEFMGERKLANVEKLIEQARTAEASGTGSLDDFVTQLAEFTTRTPKEALAATSPETANVVRLMTIHQAKGLEFPVVVVPDIDRDRPADRTQVAFHPDIGPLVNDPDAEKDDASGLKLFKRMERLAEDAESQRVFYVACTRAADYLILSAGVNDLDKPSGPWLQTLAESFDLSNGELVHAWPGDDQPHVSVPAQPPLPPIQRGPTGKRTNLLKLVEQARLPQDALAAQVEPIARRQPLDAQAQRRFSVTRLSGDIVPAGGDWWRDDAEAKAQRAGRVDPIGLGTLVHAVLERADLHQPESIAAWCEALAPQHDLLHADEAAEVARDLVEKFFASSRAAELRAAMAVEREVEFLLAWPPGAAEADARFLQGYLDCLYRGADGRWRVVDYKTNQVAAGEVSQVAEKYELQMLAYGLAVEQTWGVGPAELILHFLEPGEEHVIAWDRDAHQRASDKIDARLKEMTNTKAVSK